jgi:purine-binding chemotaxis protein CheW
LGENVDAGTGSLARRSARSDALSDLTLLIFEVDGHRYALHANEVLEILRAALPTRLAQGPDVIEGVLNIRGRVAAVLDIRARFALPRRAIKTSDVLIVCEARERLLALRADGIVDVLQVPASALASARHVGATGVYTRGVVTLSDGLLLIADIPTFLDAAEQESLARALSQRAQGESTP